jgi:argininosuccinate lyase
MNSKVSGMLSEELDPVLQRELIAPGLQRDFPVLLPHITRINKAHVLMLEAQRILPQSTGHVLARAILALESRRASDFPLDPGREDPYLNYEAAVIELAGHDAGGRLHIARSRNDLNATIDRLRARGAALGLLQGLAALRDALITQAHRYRGVLMPGYTHLQPAQPLTFGYYLAGLAHALERDYRRIIGCWPRINVCPLGAGALAGTSFPIDRVATAGWLGFDGVAPHAQDCVASRDYLMELLSGVALAATTWGRMAQDFYVMTSYEFQTLTFPDRVAQTSSMMPQKKNMTALEKLKSSSAEVLGAYVTALASARATHFSLVLDACRHAFHWTWNALEDAQRAVTIATVVVNAAEPQPRRMMELARVYFSTATDLADALVREAGLPFREAHHLVGAVVKAAMSQGRTADQIDADLIAHEAERAFGRRVVLSQDMVARAVDPAKAIEARRNTGGPSSTDMEGMLAGLVTRRDRDREELTAIAARLAAADDRLQGAFTKLAD